MQIHAPLLALVVLAGVTESQTQVVDLNTTPDTTIQSAGAGFIRPFNGKLQFLAKQPATGIELWESDGSTAGTRLVAEVNPGPGNGAGYSIVDLAPGLAVFNGYTPDTGWEIYRTDGTVAGTQLVRDINPGPGDSLAGGGMSATGGIAFFFAEDGVNGQQLWRTDGTTAGTVMVVKMGPGTASNGTSTLLAVGGKVFFDARTSVGGGSDWRVWVSDGTAAGTVPLTPPLGNYSSGPAGNMVPFLGGIAFSLDDPVRGDELWISDGTPGGTVPVAGATVGGAGFNPTALAVSGHSIYYRAWKNGAGNELWKSDGTPGGTFLLADTGPNQGFFISGNPTPMGFIGTDLIFSSTHVSVRSLYRTDGTPGSVVRFADVTTSNGGVVVSATLGSSLYFSGAGQAGLGYELWRTDGTANGTVLVKDIQPGAGSSWPYGMAEFAGRLYFSADDGVNGSELWTSDGTTAGTNLVLDIATPLVSQGSYPSLRGAFRDKLVFVVDDKTGFGSEPWISDGTAAGTKMLGDLNPGSGSSASTVTPFAATADYFLFAASTPGNGYEPWVSDGTTAGTHQLLDIWSGTSSSSPSVALTFQDRVFFSADDGVTGRELWVTDGTSGGTTLVADLHPAGDTKPVGFYVWKEQLFFLGNIGTFSEYELFVSDGTGAGTGLVVEIGPGSLAGPQGPFMGFGDHVYFSANDGASGQELWRSDGTALGTTMVADIAPGPNGSTPYGMTVIEAGLLFIADDGNGRAIWLADGVSAPQLVTTFPGNPTTGLHSVGSTAVFMLDDGTTEGLLWRTDGTSLGTQLVKVVEAYGNATQLEAFWRLGASRMFFRGDDGNGTEVWVTDGTAAGTKLVHDIAPAGSFPNGLIRAGGTVFLSANDGLHGAELHAFALADGDEWAFEPYGLGCPGSGGAVPAISLTGEAQASASQPLEVVVIGGLPNSIAVLLWSPAQGSFALNGGCKLYVGPPLFTMTRPTDATGRASVSFAPSPAFVGFEGHFQWAVIDPQGAFGNLASLTAGLEIVGGP